MKRITSILAGCVLIGAAISSMSVSKDFNEHYKIKKGSNIEKAKCTLCHTKGKALNLFGKDLGTGKLTPAKLKAMENLDSDKDGVKNIEEIKKDTLPGDPKSK